jgi:hypothetical protein
MLRRCLAALAICALPLAGFTQPRTHVTEEMERAMVNFVNVVKSHHYYIANNDPRRELIQLYCHAEY